MYDRYTGRKGVALENLMDEDWKTALALHKEDIPKGAEVYIQKMIQNLYGYYLVVRIIILFIILNQNVLS